MPAVTPPPTSLCEADIAQTRVALRNQAAAAGFALPDLEALAGAHDLAAGLLVGVFAPSGKPHLCHMADRLGETLVAIAREVASPLLAASLEAALRACREEQIPSSLRARCSADVVVGPRSAWRRPVAVLADGLLRAVQGVRRALRPPARAIRAIKALRSWRRA